MASGKLERLLYGREYRSQKPAPVFVNPVAAFICHTGKATQNRNYYEFTQYGLKGFCGRQGQKRR